MKSMEIYYDDLTITAKTEYLGFVGATYETDINVEIPIAIVDIEEEDNEYGSK